MGGFSHPIQSGRMTTEDQDKIAELAEEKGWGAARIAREVQRHPSTVAWFLYSRGIRPPQTRPQRQYVRAGRPIRTFGPEEDAFILAHRLAGEGLIAIAEAAAQRFGYRRSAGTIRNRLVMLAGRDDDASHLAAAE